MNISGHLAPNGDLSVSVSQLRSFFLSLLHTFLFPLPLYPNSMYFRCGRPPQLFHESFNKRPSSLIVLVFQLTWKLARLLHLTSHDATSKAVITKQALLEPNHMSSIFRSTMLYAFGNILLAFPMISLVISFWLYC